MVKHIDRAIKKVFFCIFWVCTTILQVCLCILHVHVTNCVDIPIVIIIVKGILIKTHVNIMNKNGYVWLKSFVIKVKCVWWRWRKLDNWTIHYHKCHNTFTFSSFYHFFKILKKLLNFIGWHILSFFQYQFFLSLLLVLEIKLIASWGCWWLMGFS